MAKQKMQPTAKQITLTLTMEQYKELLNYTIIGDFICNGIKPANKKKTAETELFFYQLLSTGYAAKSDAVIVDSDGEGYSCSKKLDAQMSKSLTSYNDTIADMAIKEVMGNLMTSAATPKAKKKKS